MRTPLHLSTRILALLGILVAGYVTAQENKSAPVGDVKSQVAEKSEAIEKPVASEKAPAAPSQSVKPQAEKKMVQDATINLQTTVTGNQEQPRVLYILPWQSPATADVDFESLDNQQKAVFGHVEREELRRELESAAEAKQ